MISFDIKSQDEFCAQIKNNHHKIGWIDPDFMEEKMKYCSIENIYPSGWTENNRFMIYAYDNEKIVGILKIKIGGKDSFSYPGFCNWVDFISVDSNYKNKGIASTLIKMMFDFLKEKNETHMLASGYSADGFNYLRLKLREMAQEYGISWKDRDKIEF